MLFAFDSLCSLLKCAMFVTIDSSCHSKIQEDDHTWKLFYVYVFANARAAFRSALSRCLFPARRCGLLRFAFVVEVADGIDAEAEEVEGPRVSAATAREP